MTSLGKSNIKIILERDGFNQLQGGFSAAVEIDNRQCEADVKKVKLILLKDVELRDRPARKVTH